uniref:Uncharacterized protein n=1 Tax=Glycine max TaxID=3847 RepID=A0A0R0G177_SOYBN
MAQKVVLKVMTMTDDKTKQKAIEAAADIYEVDCDWSNGHSENSEEAEESRKSGYSISWTCQGREEGRKERGEKGRKKRREKGGEERGEEGRKEGREEGGEKIIDNT